MSEKHFMFYIDLLLLDIIALSKMLLVFGICWARTLCSLIFQKAGGGTKFYKNVI